MAQRDAEIDAAFWYLTARGISRVEALRQCGEIVGLTASTFSSYMGASDSQKGTENICSPAALFSVGEIGLLLRPIFLVWLRCRKEYFETRLAEVLVCRQCRMNFHFAHHDKARTVGKGRSQMPSESRSQSLRIRESRRKVLRKIPHVADENHLALSVQRVRNLHPGSGCSSLVRSLSSLPLRGSRSPCPGAGRGWLRRAPSL